MTKHFIVLAFFVSTLGLAIPATKVELRAEKVGDATHWMPEKVEVTQGEKVKFVVKDDLKTGPEFHGFFIPALNISKQVNRGKTLTVETTIPKDMKPGEYPIACQFHSTHVPSTLVVKAATAEPNAAVPPTTN